MLQDNTDKAVDGRRETKTELDGRLPCRQCTGGVKHVAGYNDGTAGAVVLAADRNKANLSAGGSSSLHTRMNAAARFMQPLVTRCDVKQQTSNPVSVSCSTRQTQSARKHWHDKRSAQHSTRAAAAAPAFSSREPASHAPSPPQPISTTCGTCAYRQEQWPVADTRTPHRGA